MIEKLKASSLAFAAFSLMAVGANAAPKATTALKSNGGSALISVAFTNDTEVTVTSTKDISHVAIQYCDGTTVKFENQAFGNPYIFTSTKPMHAVTAKSGTVSSSSWSPGCPSEGSSEAPTVPTGPTGLEGPPQ